MQLGAFVGIVGPNGSGKTSLFNAISGELELITGNITLKGSDLNKIPIKEKAKKIAIVTQNNEIPDITVEDYVLLGRTPYKKQFQFLDSKSDIKLSEKYMKLTNTLKFKNCLFSELSGGEQQLVSIAKALTQEPELLLLDEPTSFLDIAHQSQILNLIQRLNEELKLTVLMNIHDLNLASEYCNQMVMINKGKIHTKGKPDVVLNKENIREVYNTDVVTVTNPESKKASILLVSEKSKRNQ